MVNTLTFNMCLKTLHIPESAAYKAAAGKTKIIMHIPTADATVMKSSQVNNVYKVT